MVIRLLFILYTCVFSSLVLAQGGYGGLRYGIASSGVDANTLDDGSVISNVSITDSTGSYSAYLGFRAGRTFHIELAYSNLGSPNVSGNSDGSGFFWFTGAVDATYDTTALHIDLVARPHITDRLSLMGKLGYYRAATVLSLTDSCCTVEVEETNTGLLFGAGLSYRLMENLEFQLDWSRFLAVGDDASFGETDIDIMGISLLYYFRSDDREW